MYIFVYIYIYICMCVSKVTIDLDLYIMWNYPKQIVLCVPIRYIGVGHFVSRLRWFVTAWRPAVR